MTADENGDFDRALAHGWAWFTVHSNQRMQLLSFFFVSCGLVIASYASLMEAGLHVAGAAVSGLGVWLVVIFRRLDQRTHELIKASEIPLTLLQKTLAERVGVPSLELIAATHDSRIRRQSYSSSISHLSVATLIIFLAGVLFACWTAAS